MRARATLDITDLAGHPTRLEFRDQGRVLEVFLADQRVAMSSWVDFHNWLITPDADQFMAGSIVWTKVGPRRCGSTASRRSPTGRQ